VPRKDARALLQAAALTLFQEKGFDQTTTADIADRAGVTERTLFRHFPDKKEVLFDDAATGCDILIASLADAPREFGPVEALFWALREFEPTLIKCRPYTHPRFQIVFANPSLLERELAKQAGLAGALASALQTRGASALTAELAARIGMAAFGDAIETWFENPSLSYIGRLDQSYMALKGLVSPPATSETL
jgi:AcrR family transcriptional regulator